MKVQAKHGKVTQNMHGASRNYRYVWDVSRTKGEESSSRSEVQLSNMAGFRWEGLGVQVGLPTHLIAPQGPPGHLYNEGEGWGVQHNLSPRPMRHPPSSKPRCSTFRPRFRRCSRSESVRVFYL